MDTVHVTSYGRCIATRAELLKKGDYIVHSFGIKSRVITRLRETKKTVVFWIAELDSDRLTPLFEKSYRKDSLVAFKSGEK